MGNATFPFFISVVDHVTKTTYRRRSDQQKIAVQRSALHSISRAKGFAKWSRMTNMDAFACAPELADIPDELIAAVRALAESDADAVGAFLRTSGLQPSKPRAEGPVEFPPEYLLGIGLGLRLKRWEDAKITAHLEAGLPTAADIFRCVGTLIRGPQLCEFVARLFIALGPVFTESFLWWVDDGDPRIEMAIVAGDDEQLLDAVADYLWGQIQHNFDQER